MTDTIVTPEALPEQANKSGGEIKSKLVFPRVPTKKKTKPIKSAKKRLPKKPVIKNSRWTDNRRAEFILLLIDSANVSQSALKMKITPSHAYAERKRNPAFAAAWKAAIEEALDGLEAVLLDRVVHGLDKPLIYQGENRGTYKHYSDALAMFMLRNRRPNAFMDAISSADEAQEGADVRTRIEARLTRLAGVKKAAEG